MSDDDKWLSDLIGTIIFCIIVLLMMIDWDVVF